MLNFVTTSHSMSVKRTVMILIPSPLELFWQNEERTMFGSNHIVTVDKI